MNKAERGLLPVKLMPKPVIEELVWCMKIRLKASTSWKSKCATSTSCIRRSISEICARVCIFMLSGVSKECKSEA